MSTRVTNSLDVDHYEYLAYQVHDGSANWICQFTAFGKGEPLITVTSPCEDPIEGLRLATHEMFRAQADYATGRMTLPDMGDFQVTYHTPIA
jgi:hypothetical protein